MANSQSHLLQKNQGLSTTKIKMGMMIGSILMAYGDSKATFPKFCADRNATLAFPMPGTVVAELENFARHQ